MFKKFVSYYRPYLFIFIIDIMAALLISGIDLIFPILTRKILNDFIPEGAIKTMLIIGFIVLGLYIIRMFLSFVLSYWGHVMGTKIEADMRKDLFKKYQVLDYQFFDDNKVGVLMSNITSHLRDIAEMSHHVPEDVFISLVLFVGSFIFLSTISLYLTLLLFGLVLLLILFSISRRTRMMKAFRANRRFHGELNAELESSLSGVRLTKAFNNQEHEIKRFGRINHQYTESWRRAYKQMGVFHSGNEFLVAFMNLTVLIVGGFFLYHGYINEVDLFTYFLYINFFIKPVQRMMTTMEQTQQGLSGFERFYQIMQMEPHIKSPVNGVTTIPQGKIEFRDVTFSYVDSENSHILNQFNLVIEKGKKVALVGQTGVGKSTISKLIPRFYELNEGKILIDDIDIADYDLSVLRNAIGHVQQEVYIFWGTIKDNILYGNPDASDEAVMEAAKAANIHDFILTLPDGYDTLTGERGIKLSGGQKQRISIARLFLKNPPILILDEATSSLDNLTEQFIHQSLNRLSADKTTITIAHRLSTIIDCDEIIVLGKEGIIERGRHQDLIETTGYYASLYRAQRRFGL